MKYITILMLAVLCGCDASESSGQQNLDGLSWKKIPCPSYSTTSGLYRLDDPDNGNTVYLHLGQHESSLYVIPASVKAK